MARGTPSRHAATATGLKFSDTLSWRAGKAIPVAELLRRLQALAAELRDIDQEELDRSSFSTPAQELASSNILTHKDWGVKAYAGCCLVDILRLCAPEAPFTAAQLKDIFTLFVNSIVPALADPSNPYNVQHLYVLQSLAQVKSVILITDVPSSNDLIRRLFNASFDVLSTSGDRLSKNVEYNITGMMECIVDECAMLPADLVDTILAQFLRADPFAGSRDGATTALEKNGMLPIRLPASYKVAKNVCNTCTERMSRYISQYFNSVIISSSSGGIDLDEDGSAVPSENDLKDLQKAHRLLRELWRSSPAVLQNVIPQIEAELHAQNEDIRRVATEAVGDLIAGIGAVDTSSAPKPDLLSPAAVDLSVAKVSNFTRAAAYQSFEQHHGSAYKTFLGRRNDKSPLVRAAWATSAGKIISAAESVAALEADAESNMLTLFSAMLLDSDERVRIACIRAIGQMSLTDVVYKLGSEGSVSKANSTLSNLASRVKDKRSLVRAEAMPLLARIWATAAGEIAAGNQTAIEMLGSIPSQILGSYYTNDPEILALIDTVLFEALVPIGYPAVKTRAKPADAADDNDSPGRPSKALSEAQADRLRAERILLLASSLEEKSQPVFTTLMTRPIKFRRFIDALMTRFEEYNGGVMDKDADSIKARLRALVDMFSKQFPDPEKASADLMKFAKLHDRRCYALIRFCISVDSDYRKIHKALREIRRRLEASSVATTTVPDTVISLAQKCAHLFFNKSHVSPIIAISREPAHALAGTANDLIKQISAQAPDILQSHAEAMCQTLASEAPDGTSKPSPANIDTLKACAVFAKRIPQSIPRDRGFSQAMMQYALKGGSPGAAKYAVRILLAADDKRDMYAKTLLKKSVETFKYGAPSFLAVLATLSQIMLLAGRDFDDEECDPVTQIAIEQVLRRTEPAHDDSDEAAEWSDEPDEHTQAKIWALKILANRIRAYNDAGAVQKLAQPVYSLLNKLVANSGTLSKKTPWSKACCSAVRLQAAQLLLRLSRQKGFDGLLSHTMFNKLAETVQDPLFVVRKRFVEKVMRSLLTEGLSSRFYVFVFLTAFEPSDGLKRECTTWLTSRSRALRQQKKPTMEVAVARYLSVLTHHPDFASDAESLKDFVTYITYYLKTVATEENISLIYHVVQRVKGVRDGIDVDKSDDLYCLSDLAQNTIRQFAELKDWTLQAYAGKVNLPYGLFQPMPDHDTAQQVSEKNYLPDGMDTVIEGTIRESLKNKKRKSEGHHDGSRTKRRVVSRPGQAPGSGAKRKPVKRRARAGEDEEDDDQAASEMRPEPGDRRRSARSSTVKPSYNEESDESGDQQQTDDAESEMEVNGGAGQHMDDVEMGSAAGGERDGDDAGGTSDKENEEGDGDEINVAQQQQQQQQRQSPPPPRKGRAGTRSSARKRKSAVK